MQQRPGQRDPGIMQQRKICGLGEKNVRGPGGTSGSHTSNLVNEFAQLKSAEQQDPLLAVKQCSLLY